MVLRSNLFLLLSVVMLLSGCSGGAGLSDEDLDQMAGGSRTETVSVSGKVTVGGTPTAGVVIYAYAQEGEPKPALQTRTGADGAYLWTTYAVGDGLAPGTYKLTFAHIPKEGKGKDEGEDLLEGKYSDPETSEFTLTVASGTPQTDVNYALE